MIARQKWRLVALWLLTLIGGIGSAQAEHRRVSGFVDELTLDRFGMTRLWYSQVPTLRLRERVLTLKQKEDLLFAASDKGQLHCLEAETGKLRWSQDVSETPGEVFPPALTAKFVYVCSGSRFSQLDRQTGQIIQTRSLPSACTSGPAANDDFCYVQTVDNFLYAIALKSDPEDEGKIWPFKRKFTLPYVRWFFNVGSPLANPPIAAKDRVIFAGNNGVVFASSLQERNILYRFITNSKVSAPISFRDRTYYVATEDYNLYAVDLNGQLRWRFASGFPIVRQPVPLADDVLITPEGVGLMCVSNADGKLRWINDAAYRVVGVSQKRIYAVSSTMRFLILDRADGTTVGSWFSPDFPITAYNQTTDRIFQATERGLIQCLAERENVTPYFHETLPTSTDAESAPPAETEAEETESPSTPEPPSANPPDADADDPDAMEKEEEPAEEGDKPSDESMPEESSEEPAKEAGEEPADDGAAEEPSEEMTEEAPEEEPRF
jgi:outer membrane protein assembly factor BamB